VKFSKQHKTCSILLNQNNSKINTPVANPQFYPLPKLAIFEKNKSGSSSVGRATASQAVGREFEPRFPLYW
jgi:hypothetical protein